MRRRPGAATIAEVAEKAGVSPATVSRVMNDRFHGEPTVAERVVAVAAELAYSPSHLARSLALGRTSAVGFVVPDLGNPAFQGILSGLSKAAGRDGYRVLVADSAESAEDEPALASEMRRRCDTLVLCAPRMPDSALTALAGSLSPLVLINRMTPGLTAPSLSIDYFRGIQNLAQHLWNLGHRHMVFVTGPHDSTSNQQRIEGLAEFQRRTPDVRVDRVVGGATSEDGIAAAEPVIASGATTALAFNDLVAIGLLHGLIERGVRVPEDISVTGFDDIPFAKYNAPALTTVSVPHEELGAQAWHRMHSLVDGGSLGPDVVFHPRLEVRESTGPAPS